MSVLTDRPAVPLRDAAGVIRAWACPRCLRVSMSVSCNGPNGRMQEAEYSLERARQCGICEACGIQLPCHTFARLCPACRQAEHDRIAAHVASLPPPVQPTPESFETQVARLRALIDRDDLSEAEQRALAAVLERVV